MENSIFPSRRLGNIVIVTNIKYRIKIRNLLVIIIKQIVYKTKEKKNYFTTKERFIKTNPKLHIREKSIKYNIKY